MNIERNTFLDKFDPNSEMAKNSSNKVAEVLAKFDIQAVRQAADMTIQNNQETLGPAQ